MFAASNVVGELRNYSASLPFEPCRVDHLFTSVTRTGKSFKNYRVVVRLREANRSCRTLQHRCNEHRPETKRTTGKAAGIYGRTWLAEDELFKEQLRHGRTCIGHGRITVPRVIHTESGETREGRIRASAAATSKRRQFDRWIRDRSGPLDAVISVRPLRASFSTSERERDRELAPYKRAVPACAPLPWRRARRGFIDALVVELTLPGLGYRWTPLLRRCCC